MDASLTPHSEERPTVVDPKGPRADDPAMAARRAEPLKPRPRAPGEELSLIRIVGQPVAGAELIPEGPVVQEGEGRQVRRQVQRPGVTAWHPRDGHEAFGDVAGHGGEQGRSKAGRGRARAEKLRPRRKGILSSSRSLEGEPGP